MASTSIIKPSVGGVVFRGTDVLLIQRGRPPFAEHWSIPGGKVDFGERLQDAVLREIHEETGITAKVIGLIDAFEALPERDGDGHYIMIDYVCDWVAGEPHAADDAMAAEFVPFGEALSRLAWDQTRLALQKAKAAIARAREG